MCECANGIITGDNNTRNAAERLTMVPIGTQEDEVEEQEVVRKGVSSDCYFSFQCEERFERRHEVMGLDTRPLKN